MLLVDFVILAVIFLHLYVYTSAFSPSIIPSISNLLNSFVVYINTNFYAILLVFDANFLFIAVALQHDVIFRLHFTVFVAKIMLFLIVFKNPTALRAWNFIRYAILPLILAIVRNFVHLSGYAQLKNQEFLVLILLVRLWVVRAQVCVGVFVDHAILLLNCGQSWFLNQSRGYLSDWIFFTFLLSAFYSSVHFVP